MADGVIDLAARAAQLRRPGEGLAALAALRRQLDDLEAAHVRGALDAGWSWRRIADALGVSRQAAHKKHARRASATDGAPPLAPPAAGRMLVTAQARRAVRLAREEAGRLGLPDVGPAELLLGLIHEGHGPAARALIGCGLTLERLRKVLAVSGDAEVGEPSGPLPISPAVRHAFERSLAEALRLRDGHLGVEHVLLALLRADADVAHLLERLGVSPNRVERRLARILDEPSVVLQPAAPGYPRATGS